jgi:hypothetical protein
MQTLISTFARRGIGRWKTKRQHSPRQELFCSPAAIRERVRIVPSKALRAGRFVVAPQDCPASWKELSDFIWIGDVEEGIQWAFANREEACRKIATSQSYIQDTFQSAVDRVAMGGPVRLDLGAGHKHEDGWVRVDFALDRKKCTTKGGVTKSRSPDPAGCGS